MRTRALLPQRDLVPLAGRIIANRGLPSHEQSCGRRMKPSAKHTMAKAVRTFRRPPCSIGCPDRRRTGVGRERAEAPAGRWGAPGGGGYAPRCSCARSGRAANRPAPTVRAREYVDPNPGLAASRTAPSLRRVDARLRGGNRASPGTPLRPPPDGPSETGSCSYPARGVERAAASDGLHRPR